MYWASLKPHPGKEQEIAAHPEVLDLPKSEMYLASCCNILRHQYGFMESADGEMSVDKNGSYLPLFTYPSIEYLNQFDYSDKKIFEFGAGGSTLFWMKRSKQVVSIESNQEWFKKLTPLVASNVELRLSQGDKYPFEILLSEDAYDVIIIDGAGYRFDCAEQALTKLAPGGIIILDNADWHPNTAKLIKDFGLLQIDMSGFKPGELHTSTTSLFLSRDFDFATLNARQPSFAWGAKEIHSSDWDKRYAKP